MALKSSTSKEIETLKNKTLTALKESCSLCLFLKGEVPEGAYIYSVANGNDVTSFLAVAKYSKHRWAILTPENMDIEEASIIHHFLESKVPEGAEVLVFTPRDLQYVDKYRYERKISMVFQSI